MQTLLVHIMNEEPILAEVEEMPTATDQALFLMAPRRRDGKPLRYVLAEVQQIIVPWHRITFVEVMPSGQEEEIVSPFADL
jgi:hypothetical protein